MVVRGDAKGIILRLFLKLDLFLNEMGWTKFTDNF